MASIRDYWIEEIRNTREFTILSHIEDEELFLVKDGINKLIDDQFIKTATEKGIARREKMLKIVPFADDTLETRRFRVSNRWNESLPYTHKVLINKLNQMCGNDGYTVELNRDSYTLKIRIELTQKRMFEEAKLMVRRICPANLVIDIELRYNQHKDFRGLAHAQLAKFTHNQLRNEVVQ